MAVAVRIARAHTGKDKIAFCGYHGWHDWYLAANLGTENALGEHLLSGLSPLGVPKGLTGTALPFRYNHLEELENIVAEHKDEIGVIVMEPIRDTNPVPGFIEGVRSMANEIGAVFIVDEISAGFRLTTGGAHLIVHPVSPDIAVFSKALGNGYPIAAIIGKADVMQAAQKTFISSTYWTDRIGPTAALAMIQKHRNMNVADHLIHLGDQVQKGWRKLPDKYSLSLHVGGLKPISRFTFEMEDAQAVKAYFIQLMLDQGYLASNLFYASYAHTEDHVKSYLEATDRAFAEIAHSLEEGNLQEKLQGKPSSVGFKRIT
jgi:glutamate-1-semialdehyde 2,1-aminomutase